MKITVDTNILVRAILQDDPEQTKLAQKLLRDAALIAISLVSLCELVWILRQGAKVSKADTAAAIRTLMAAKNVALNRPATQAGLALLDAGGDFADAVIAYEGRWLGGETFVSFDKQATSLMTKQGQAALLLR